MKTLVNFVVVNKINRFKFTQTKNVASTPEV